MLRIEVKNGKLEPALKKYKRKVRNTKLVQRIRDGQAYMKPSSKRRLQLQKAKYRNKKGLEDDT